MPGPFSPLRRLGLLTGETVVVERRQEVGRDPGNAPIYEWVPETVDDVLVTPGASTDVIESNRPEGVEVGWTLGFPRGYPATLRGARVSVRGQEPAPVIGDPQHLTDANTPGRWTMPVEIERTDG